MSGQRITVKYGTAAAWTANDPILVIGEMGYESDTSKLKFGDGVTAWSGLSYFAGTGLAAVVEDLTPQLGGDLDLNGNVITGLEIGVDVQAYSAILAATTASFTTADETKLDGIETGADVTDATNVAAAGAVMKSDVKTFSFKYANPTASDTEVLTKILDVATTITEVRAYTDDGATVTLQLEERASTTPNTTGTDIMTSSLVAAATPASTTSFTNAGIGADAILYLKTSAITGTPTYLSVEIDYTID